MTARRLLGIFACVGLGVVVIFWAWRQSTPAPPILRFAVMDDSYPDSFWNPILAEFEVSAGGARVERVVIEAAKYSHLVPGSFDVALIPAQIVRQRATEFADLSEWAAGISNVLEPIALNSLRLDGTQRALPFAGQSLLIYFNRNCFDNASTFHGTPVDLPGLEWTISEFVNTAEKLTCDFDRDGTTDQFGLLLPDWYHFQPLMESMGASLISEDGMRWALSGPEAIAALGLYRRLSTGDRVAAPAAELNAESVSASLLSGKVAMVLGGTALAAVLRGAAPSFNYGVAHIPRGRSGRETKFTWSALVIPESLSHERRNYAARLIQHVLSHQVQTRLAELGTDIPARLDTHDAFAARDSDRRRPFIESMSYGQISTLSPMSGKVAEALQRHFDRIADPALPFRAQAIIDSLAGDPAIVEAIAATR